MKKVSAIMRLYYDGPCRLERIEMSAEHSDLLNAAADLEKQLENILKDDSKSKDLFKRYNNVVDKLTSLETALVFEQAVKYGVMLGIELGEE